MKVIWKGAAIGNFEVGRKVTVDRVVLHWIVGKLAAADAEFQKSSRQASAHYGIGNKVIHQYVKDEDTAYHCGNLAFNRRSIGIEHEGGPTIPITDETYTTSAELVATICKKYAIPLDRTHIVGHREVSATQCPGILDIERVIREAKVFSVPAGESPDLIACKAQVADEIRKKNETWQELQEVKQALEGAKTEANTYKEEQLNILRTISAQLGDATADLPSITGSIAKLISGEDKDSSLTKENTDLKARNATLASDVSRLGEELAKLRPVVVEKEALEREVKKLKESVNLVKVSPFILGRCLAKRAR